MFDYDQIDEYQIEVTSHCNAACPQCPRNINGGRINPHMPLQHLGRDIIDAAFPASLVQRLQQIFFCGSYGDPIMHPEFLEILQDFRHKNPTVWLYVHTNGGVHDPRYWDRMARIMAGYGKVDFGIDGLDDTNHLYRQNVKFNKVMDNAQAFIDAGGRAQWNCIVFEHNEHQIESIRQRAMDMGFINVQFRSTGRFFDHGTMTAMESWPVRSASGQVVRWLQPAQGSQYQNRSIQRLPRLREEYNSWRDYFDTTKIQCDALKGRKVAINCQGLVLPCNFFNHNLYDARFHDPSVAPGCNDLARTDGHNQVKKFLERYGLDRLSIQHHSLEEIFQVPMWQDLVAGFDKPIGQGRLFECAMTCGTQFTKVWDQNAV